MSTEENPQDAGKGAGLTIEEWNTGVRTTGTLLSSLWPDYPDISIADYAAERRSLPLGTPFPGPWDNDRTPYLRELMDDMGPQSPIQEEYCLKGHQIGFTAAAENIILYWMDLNPTEILFVSATDDALKTWATKRLEAAIDSVGMRAKITGQTSNKKSRRSGDTTLSKEFVGGSLKMASAQAAAALRSMSKRVLIIDEMDGAPAQLKTGEGIYVDVAIARTTAFGNRKKILGFSTPTTFNDSLIWRKYQDGDQRKYLVPCPHCGRAQELVLAAGEMRHGLHGETKAGEFVRAYYICEFCGDEIEEFHKAKMLRDGHWEATVKSKSPFYRSRHISSLYSPPGMCSWDEFYSKFAEAREDFTKMPSFTNLYLGLPYEQSGAKPPISTVQTLRGNYAEFTIPEGVTFLTAGIDVQRGKDRPDPDNPQTQSRIEMQILGHGAGYRTWAIAYLVFIGPTDDVMSGAWEKLYQYFMTGKAQFWRGNRLFPVMKVFVDAGDRPAVVYQFCNRTKLFFPCKGMPQIIADEKKRERGVLPEGKLYYRKASLTGGQVLYEVNVRLYKEAIYSAITRSGAANRDPSAKIQRTGFIDFPMNLPDEYFQSLTAEELKVDGSYDKFHTRNEALDTAVYATCAQHVFLDEIIDFIQREMREKGAAKWQIDAITPTEAFRYLETMADAQLHKTPPPEPVDHAVPVSS